MLQFFLWWAMRNAKCEMWEEFNEHFHEMFFVSPVFILLITLAFLGSYSFVGDMKKPKWFVTKIRNNNNEWKQLNKIYVYFVWVACMWQCDSSRHSESELLKRKIKTKMKNDKKLKKRSWCLLGWLLRNVWMENWYKIQRPNVRPTDRSTKVMTAWWS